MLQTSPTFNSLSNCFTFFVLQTHIFPDIFLTECFNYQRAQTFTYIIQLTIEDKMFETKKGTGVWGIKK